jgi:hypothetical protein
MEGIENTCMNVPRETLRPLPYHVELRDYLKAKEGSLWKWFASAQAQAAYFDSLRLELLKATYRLDAGSHPELYQGLDEVKAALGLDIPVTIYQAQHANDLNATLFYIPGEGHVVLSGPMLSLLSAEEIKSVLGHELAHYHLWQADEGELLIVDRLLQAVCQDHRAHESHVQSARWFQLYTEIYADRGSLRATGNIESAVAALVKIMTGLQHVSGGSYLKQAEEVFQKSDVKTTGLSHPEAFIRARALQLWAEGAEDCDRLIATMIEGSAAFDDLDLLGQVRLTRFTRKFLEQLLQPKWFRTDAVMGHAKLLFDDFAPANAPDESFLAGTEFGERKMQEYLCFLLLDFVSVDPELDRLPLAAALEWSKRLEILPAFEKLVNKELKVKARDINKLKNEAAELLAKAEAAA